MTTTPPTSANDLNPQQLELFQRLNEIREEGSINMFMAARVLVDEGYCDRSTAQIVLSQWMHWGHQLTTT
jgi:hypothetical protein